MKCLSCSQVCSPRLSLTPLGRRNSWIVMPLPCRIRARWEGVGGLYVSGVFCFVFLCLRISVYGGWGDKHNRHLQLWRDKAITLSALLVLYPYPNSHSISSLERLRTKTSSWQASTAVSYMASSATVCHFLFQAIHNCMVYCALARSVSILNVTRYP